MGDKMFNVITRAMAALCIDASRAYAADTQISVTPAAPPPHAPLRVFGADMPAVGKLVLSIMPQFANLSTILKGTRAVSSEEVVATTPWYYDPTKKLRGVPQNTVVTTQTVALAYGVTQDLALVVTVDMVEKNLDSLRSKAQSASPDSA